MPRAAKRRKTEIERFECFSCAVERTTAQFPNYNPTETCDHLINTCKQCLKAWIDVQMESTMVKGGIKCPQCDEIMKGTDVKMATTKKVFERFDELERHYIAENNPGWRWCLSSTCRAGQVHVRSEVKEPSENQAKPPAKKKKSKRGLFDMFKIHTDPTAEDHEADADVCVCDECGAKACVPCDRPWHAGETCAEYQARIKDRVEEEDESLKRIQKLTKRCPQCKKSIEKNGGCPAMHCSQCMCNFCWNCLSPFGQDGVYCKCHPQAARP